VGHTGAVPDRPAWIRPVLSLLVVIGVGAVVLAGGAWLAVKVLPNSEDSEDESSDESDADIAKLHEAGVVN